MNKVVLHTLKDGIKDLNSVTIVNKTSLQRMIGDKFFDRLIQSMENDTSLVNAKVYAIKRDEKYTYFYIVGRMRLDILTEELPTQMLTGAYAMI
tara:strand:+ start:4130 stop:4411 length:282 start_codon:yes stop_codon:yes gene_type:complete